VAVAFVKVLRAVKLFAVYVLGIVVEELTKILVVVEENLSAEAYQTLADVEEKALPWF